MLGDKERQILGRLSDAEFALRNARGKAIEAGIDRVAIELRIVIIALAAVQEILKDELPEYGQE